MKKLLPLALSAILPWLASGCFRQELQVAQYHIPEMNSPAADAYIQSRLKGLPGIKTLSSDLEKRTLTVSYQSSTIRRMNIEESIAFIGFSVNNRPANPNAKPPAGLKKNK